MGEPMNPLFKEMPYSYKLQKGNIAQISYKAKIIGTASGKEYNKLLRVIVLDNIYELQMFLEKIMRHNNIV